jgi:hypothetical protein
MSKLLLEPYIPGSRVIFRFCGTLSGVLIKSVIWHDSHLVTVFYVSRMIGRLGARG